MVVFSLILLLVAAILAIQIANESILALRVKQSLFLVQPYSKRLLTLSYFSTWWKLVPRYFLILTPLIILIVLVLRFHHFLFELLDCQYCTATWVAFFLLYFFSTETLIHCIILSPLSILLVYIIERIRR